MNVITTLFVSIFVICCSLLSSTIDGYPTGAGSCIGGKAAVDVDNSPHLDTSGGVRQVFGGPLIQGMTGIRLTEKDSSTTAPATTFLQEGGTTSISVGIDYSVTVATEYLDEGGFKGVLIRLQLPDNSGIDPSTVLTTNDGDSLLQVSDLCTSPVVGLTHVDNTPKPSVSATLRFDQPLTEPAILEITVVGINDDRGSLYGYALYNLDVVGSASVDTTDTTTTTTTTATTTATATGAGNDVVVTSDGTPAPTINVLKLKNDIAYTAPPMNPGLSASAAADINTIKKCFISSIIISLTFILLRNM